MCYGTILSDSLQRARKQHTCDLCDRPIKLGRVYEKTVYSEGGELGTQRTCSRCKAALAVTRTNRSGESVADDDGCLYGDWRAMAKEIVKGTPIKELLRKARQALAPWREKKPKRSAPDQTTKSGLPGEKK